VNPPVPAPDLTTLLRNLGMSLIELSRTGPLDALGRAATLNRITSDYAALTTAISELQRRLAQEHTVTEAHRATAALLMTAICSPEVPEDVINEIIGEMRTRATQTPEEAHLVILGMIDIVFFLARTLEGRGVELDEVLRQAIYRANHDRSRE
jgi:predicted DNA-binding protein (UPF0278 family)